jgi:transposase
VKAGPWLGAGTDGIRRARCWSSYYRGTDRGQQESYPRRNVEERCVNRLKEWIRMATRIAKRAAPCQAMVLITALAI